MEEGFPLVDGGANQSLSPITTLEKVFHFLRLQLLSVKQALKLQENFPLRSNKYVSHQTTTK